MSLFFADPAELYAIADRIERHAAAVRSSAGTLSGAISAARWRGTAAEVFAAEARSVICAMRSCADRLEDAADALRHHAKQVQGVFDEIRRLWHDIEQFGETLTHDVGDFLFGSDATLVAVGPAAALLTRVEH